MNKTQAKKFAEKAANPRFAGKAAFDPFLFIFEIAEDTKQPQGVRMAAALELLPYLRPKNKAAPLDWPLGIPKDATAQETAKIILQSVADAILPLEHGLMMLAMVEKAHGFSLAGELEDIRNQLASLSAPDGQAVISGPTQAWLRMKTVHDERATHPGDPNLRPAE